MATTAASASASAPSAQSASTAASTSTATTAATSSAAATAAATPSGKRLYRSAGAAGADSSGAPAAPAAGGSSGKGLWVTREIAALNFLLGIPLEAEAEIVHSGWLQHQQHRVENEVVGGLDRRESSDDEEGEDDGGAARHDRRGGVEDAAAAHGGDDDAAKPVPLVGGHQQPPFPRQQQTQSLASAAPLQQQQTTTQQLQGRWWEKWIKSHHPSALSSASALTSTSGDSSDKKNNKHGTLSSDQLEQPTKAEKATVVFVEGGMLPSSAPRMNAKNSSGAKATTAAAAAASTTVPIVPGRRLEGDNAVRVQIPLRTTSTMTKQKSIARLAALREWELQTAHGLVDSRPPMLDGRLFFSADGSYPVSVFSLIRYEPRKEEAAMRRRKLERSGGGGSQFVIPARDWRGISYKALLPRVENDSKAFNRFLRRESTQLHSGGSTGNADDSDSSVSSDDSDVYVPGLLDDPDMVLGRHRNVMIGDRVTGPIVASTIQFVEPALLKLELNKQFRERFDGWVSFLIVLYYYFDALPWSDFLI